MFKRFMTPLGRELLEQLFNGSEWQVSKDNEDWTHKPSGVQLYKFSPMTVRVARIPNLDVSSDERRKLLNLWDEIILHNAMGHALREHVECTKQNAAETAINLLRLSQHKENNNV